MTLTRTLSVVYGSLTIGGSNAEVLLDGPVVVAPHGPLSVSVSCVAVLRPSTDSDAAFETLLDTVTTEMRTPRLRLRIIEGATTIRDFNPASGAKSGFNTEPILSETGDPDVDSKRSRRCNFTWEIDLPADNYGQAGRADSSIQVAYDGSNIKTVTISGEYRSTSSTASARAVYEAGITSYASTILSGLSGTYDLANREATSDETDSICTFSHTYRQIIRNQAIATLDHAALIEPDLRLDLSSEFPGDAPGRRVARLRTVTASYSSGVDQAVSTDLYGLWTGTVEPHILQSVADVFGGTVTAIVNRSIKPAVDKNRLEGSLTLLVTSGGTTLSYRLTTRLYSDPGEVEEPLGNGDEFGRFVYNGPATLQQTVTEITRTLGVTSSALKRSSRPPALAGGMGVQINFQPTDDSGELSSRSAFDLVPSRPAEEKKAGETAAKPKPATQPGEWSAPIVTTDSEDLVLGESSRSFKVTDTTVVRVRRWRVPYKPAFIQRTTGGA